MLAALAAADPLVQATFAEASAVLGYDLWALCQQGPEAELGSTERTQPAMLAAGVATWRCWLGRGGPRPLAMAGHSLGEYTALVCSGALDFRDAVDLVRFRGRVMQEAVPLGTGAMAAILGLADDQVVAADPVTQEVLELVRRVAVTDATVMITGESGTGKEVLARTLHRLSHRSAKPFVAINCAAIPENLLESTLFGHEKGAFTGAVTAATGKFEQAEGGTLLLDEVSEMPLGLQAKLLGLAGAQHPVVQFAQAQGVAAVPGWQRLNQHSQVGAGQRQVQLVGKPTGGARAVGDTACVNRSFQAL
jgi:hypothetical protein